MISDIEVLDGTAMNHTLVSFKDESWVCSCGQSSATLGFPPKNLPNLRERHCIVCTKPTPFLRDELDAWLCAEHDEEFFDWKSLNPELPAMDFLREKI